MVDEGTMTKPITPESAALTARIIELKAAGLSWTEIGRRVGLSQQAAAWRGRARRDDEVIRLRAENAKLRKRLERIQRIVEEVTNGTRS